VDKIGIISGDGELPLSIGNNLISKGYEVIFFCIKNSVNLSYYKKYDYVEIEINSFTKIIDSLTKKEINKIIMVGKISRPTIKDIKFDLNTIKLIKEYFLESKGDDALLKSISKFFFKRGFPLFDWKNICNELFSSKDNLTNNKPSEFAIKNMSKGLEIFSIIGKSDVGQAIIVQNQLVLGIECVEGTDNLIKRCEKYKKNDDRGILLKLTKHKQHNELDLPTIGIQTVINIKKCNYEGLFIEKNECIIINKNQVIDFCNNNNLFLSTFNKNL